MRILLVAEGHLHELRGEGEKGALEILVDRLLGDRHDFEKTQIKHGRRHVEPGKKEPLVKLVIAWLREAQRKGKEAVVLVVDCDRERKRLRSMKEAQEDTSVSIKRALGVAIPTFDAWMLADETALSESLGCAINCQPDPEDLKDPKERFQRLLEGSPASMSQGEAYARIALEVRLEVLEKRCARGFAPFAENVRGLTGK